MRFLSTLDWRDFFESVSLIDPVLGRDPAGAYLKMEFATRDRYRHVVERISKQARVSEVEVAETAVRMAAEADHNVVVAEPRSHVGYYLIGPGRFQLGAAWCCHVPA